MAPEWADRESTVTDTTLPAGRPAMAAWWPGGHALMHRHGVALLIALAALVLFVLVDRPLSQWVGTLDAVWIAPFEAITGLGNSRNSLVPLAGAAMIAAAAHHGLRRGRAAEMWAWVALALVFVFAAVALSGIACNVVKVLVGRARPMVGAESGDFGFAPFSFGYAYNSFPSGHANTLFALALAVGCLVPRAVPAVLALAGAVALSRVAIGVHYPSDVAGGALMAVITTRLLRDAFAARGWVFAIGGDGRVGVQRPGRRLLGLARRRWRRALDRLGGKHDG